MPVTANKGLVRYDDVKDWVKGAEAEAIKDTIKAEMGDAEELRAGEYKVTWKAVTSSRLDTTALKKALPDVAARFMKSTTSRRFCVA